MALKSKKTNFFLGDLLENRVDTTYIHKEWSKIVTFVLKEKRKMRVYKSRILLLKLWDQ